MDGTFFVHSLVVHSLVIINEDGHTKNDCERNATRRWLKRFRQEHPHLPVIIVEDALSVNAPHLDDLREARAHYIIGVKPGDATISNTTTDMACRICPWC